MLDVYVYVHVYTRVYCTHSMIINGQRLNMITEMYTNEVNRLTENEVREKHFESKYETFTQ